MATRKRASKANKSPQAKTAPEASNLAPEDTVNAKTQNATTENNPASTTSAADSSREPDNGNAGESGGTGPGSSEQAAGEFHSHSAETAAERMQRLAGTTVTGSMELPAGDFADPSKNPDILKSGEGKELGESSQDESGALQDATREAIGAGKGAPDGIGDDAVPSPEGSAPADDIEPVKVNDALTFQGNKAKLWRMIEKGATHDEMREATKHISAIGTIYVMAEQAGREIEVGKDKEGVRTYKLKAEKKGK